MSSHETSCFVVYVRSRMGGLKALNGGERLFEMSVYLSYAAFVCGICMFEHYEVV